MSVCVVLVFLFYVDVLFVFLVFRSMPGASMEKHQTQEWVRWDSNSSVNECASFVGCNEDMTSVQLVPNWGTLSAWEFS